MRKIPTLFERVFLNGKVVGYTDIVTPGCECILLGEGTPTVKIDGSCCAIIDGKFYKRYDAKNGKPVPKNAIRCQEEADPITGHFPCWVLVEAANPADKWFIDAYENSKLLSLNVLKDATYEAIGPHFQGNPYNLKQDVLEEHGIREILMPKENRSFEMIRDYVTCHDHEGIVFWVDGQPFCKIKRSDFGLEFPTKLSNIIKQKLEEQSNEKSQGHE